MSENSYNSYFNTNQNIYEDKTEPSSRMMSAETRKIKNLIEPINPIANENSLLNGAYDEKEAQESFQQALAEWRNSSKPSQITNSKKNKENINIKKVHYSQSKNASIGTDNDDLKTDRSVSIKRLEDQISSHSLSYAERCLVQKFRRNDITFTPDNTPSMNKSVEIQENPVLIEVFLEKLQNLKKIIIIFIQEISQTNNLNESFNRNSLKLLEPDLIDNKPIAELITSKSVSYTRPDFKQRPKTPSTPNRPQSSRPNSSLKKSLNSSIALAAIESNICRNTSDELKQISQRKVEIVNDNLNTDIGTFLMLDVEKTQDTINNPKESARIEINPNIKISHMLYEMSPRSWRPSSSLAFSQNKTDVNKVLTKS